MAIRDIPEPMASLTEEIGGLLDGYFTSMAAMLATRFGLDTREVSAAIRSFRRSRADTSPDWRSSRSPVETESTVLLRPSEFPSIRATFFSRYSRDGKVSTVPHGAVFLTSGESTAMTPLLKEAGCRFIADISDRGKVGGWVFPSEHGLLIKDLLSSRGFVLTVDPKPEGMPSLPKETRTSPLLSKLRPPPVESE